MATTPATVKQLLDQLIVAVTAITPQADPENFQICQEYALRSIKNHTFMQTNPFHINSRLDELEERFSIVCKDHIADAIHSRRDELKALNFKWSAETLQLILSLCWRPVEYACLSKLGTANKTEQKELTWDDIIGDEPLEGGDIWDEMNLDHGSELSSELDGRSATEEESVDHDMMNVTVRNSTRGQEEEAQIFPIDCFLIPVDWSHLSHLKGAQYWHVPARVLPGQVDTSLSIREGHDLWLISELHAVRETLFMLSGFPCTLYEVGRRTLTEGKDPNVIWVDTHRLKKKFSLRHASREGFISVLEWFAKRGTAINRIRDFVRRRGEIPSRQSFLAALTNSLATLSHKLVECEGSYVTKNGNAQVTSLLQLQQSLETELRPYTVLSAIVIRLSQSTFVSSQHSSEHLDILFDSACLFQSTGDVRSFEFIAKIFFHCLQTYLRPIREWMECGGIGQHDTTFFVRKSRQDDEGESSAMEEVNLSTLWHDQYAILRNEQGIPKAPRFVLSSINTIFTTGKSVVFLKRLINYETPPAPAASELDFNTIYPRDRADIDGLAPFDELFSSAFFAWTKKRHHSVSAKLRDVLFTNCGLWKVLTAIQHIYLGADGAQLSALATSVFERLDNVPVNTNIGRGMRHSGGRFRGIRAKKRGNSIWNDRFVLTELVQSVFGIWDFVDVKRLGVRRVTLPENLNNAEASGVPRSVRHLAGIAIEYALPWPLVNILHPASMEVYKSAFTLLLQLKRGRYALERLPVRDIENRSSGNVRSGKGSLVEQLYLHLRHKLLWFVNAVTTYVTYHILKPRTLNMATNMHRAEDVDAMVRVHDLFVQNLKEEILLAENFAPFHNVILNLLDVCVCFADAHTTYLSAIENAHLLPLAKSDSHIPIPGTYDSDSDLDTGGVPLFVAPQPPHSSRALMPPPPRPPRYHRPVRRPTRRFTQSPSIPSSSEGEEDTASEFDIDIDIDIDSTLDFMDKGRSGGGEKFEHVQVSVEELEEKHERKLGDLRGEYESGLVFLKNSLRGMSRAKELPHLEVFAECLEEAGAIGMGVGGSNALATEDIEDVDMIGQG